MAKFDIWEEGYCVQGGRDEASLLASGVEGNTFNEAVLNWVSNNLVRAVEKDVSLNLKKRYLPYDPVANPIEVTFWGCRVFPTEEEARKSFG